MSIYDNLLEKLDGKAYSNYFVSCCVFHDDSSPSLFCYEDGRFRCAACGKNGTLSYLDKYLGSQYHSSLVTRSQKSSVLPRWKKWEQEYGDIQGIAKYAHDNLKRYKQFQSYFRKRKIDEYIEEGYFGYITGWNVFPVFSPEHAIIDLVVRAGSGKGDTRYVICPRPDLSRPLYSPNWKKVKEAETVFVVYGLIDAWALHSLGLSVVTGITGKSLPAEILKPLGKRFVVVPDLNEERDAYQLVNKLGWRGKVKFLKYDDCKDPDEIRMKYGNDYLLTMLGI